MSHRKEARSAKNDAFSFEVHLGKLRATNQRKGLGLVSGSWAFKFPLRLRILRGSVKQPVLHGWKMFQLHPGLPPIMEVEDGFGTQDGLPLGSCSGSSTSIMEGRVSHDQEMTYIFNWVLPTV